MKQTMSNHGASIIIMMVVLFLVYLSNSNKLTSLRTLFTTPGNDGTVAPVDPTNDGFSWKKILDKMKTPNGEISGPIGKE